MALYSLKETYPDYRSTFSDNSIGHIDDYSVYAQSDEKVGTVEDGLFDGDTGQFRYLIVDTGAWIFGKKVLLPIGKTQFDNNERRVYVHGLTKDQVENLPKYEGVDSLNYDYEENVRGVYRGNSAVSQSAPVSDTAVVGTAAYTQDTYAYDNEPDLYKLNEEREPNQTIRLYEERLVADKQRVKAGDVAIGKRVETETAQVAIPVEKERVVIERTAPTGATATTDHAFNEGEVARVDVYEEKATVGKEAVVREEVNIRKEREQETVSESATIRREELDVDTDNKSTVISR